MTAAPEVQDIHQFYKLIGDKHATILIKEENFDRIHGKILGLKDGYLEFWDFEKETKRRIMFANVWTITCGDNDEAVKLTLKKFTSYKKPDFQIKELEVFELKQGSFPEKSDVLWSAHEDIPRRLGDLLYKVGAEVEVFNDQFHELMEVVEKHVDHHFGHDQAKHKFAFEKLIKPYKDLLEQAWEFGENIADNASYWSDEADEDVIAERDDMRDEMRYRWGSDYQTIEEKEESRAHILKISDIVKN